MTPSSHAPSRYDDLLQPVSDTHPCGHDLEYDPAFIMLQAAAAPAAAVQYGDFVETPPSANWAEAERECKALLARTKDIRIALILLRAAVRQRGAPGLRDGLGFLHALLARYGTALHPSPHADGDWGAWDPVIVANALAALADAEGLLADLREMWLPRAAGAQLQMRDIEKALAVPRQKDALAPESVGRLLRELAARGDEAVLALAAAHESLARIDAWAREELGSEAPELSVVARMLEPFSEIEPASAPVPAQTDADAACVPAAPGRPVPEPMATSMAPAPAPAMDRWTALATMRQLRVWFEDNEPSSPVTVMLRQAERLVGKRFSEVAQSIPFDLLSKWDAVED